MNDSDTVINLADVRRRKREAEDFDRAYDNLVASGAASLLETDAQTDNILFRLFGRAAFEDVIMARKPTKDERKRYGRDVWVYFHKDHPNAPRFVVPKRYLVYSDGDSGDVLRNVPIA